jgi:hypothetical protein
MLITILLFVFSAILSMLCLILPKISIWPDQMLSALEYFGQKMSLLKILPFAIDTLSECIILFLTFLGFWFSAKLILSLINWIRGSGELKTS